ncbi:MAG: hypothetical protein IJH31_01865 [Erysipelotrichaceae bacterium]|nr:hypothetical protein [Erysipelotrichaceae bacterium]
MANRHIWVYRSSYKRVRFDYITPNTTFVRGTTLYDELEAVVPTSELTGSNIEQGRDSLNRIIAGIIRLVVAPDFNKDIQLYISDGYHVLELGNQSANYSAATSHIGDIKWVYGSTCYLRIDSLITDRDIFIFEDTSSTLGILSANNIPLMVDKINNENAVLISNDLKTFLFKTKPLEYENSLRWNLHSTAGMDVEYFKIERCYQGGGVIGSIGEDLVSYKEDNEHDQYRDGSSVSTRYNKSKYGEAQIRVWGANSNQYIKVYYKNYQTGTIYNPNNAPIVYDGILTFNSANQPCILNGNLSSITKLDGYNSIRFNKYIDKDNYIEYKIGGLVDYINILIDGKEYNINEDTPIYYDDDGSECGFIMPGAIINYKRNNNAVSLKIFAVSNDLTINVILKKLKITYNNQTLFNDEFSNKKLKTKESLLIDDIKIDTKTIL